MGMRPGSILGVDLYRTSTFGGGGGALNLLTAWKLPK